MKKATSHPQSKPDFPIAVHSFSFLLPALQEEEERLRREEERAIKRQQKTADSAQSAGLEEDQQEEVDTSQSQQQPAAFSAVATNSSQGVEGLDSVKADDSQQTQQQQQPQAKLQAAAAPAAKLTKAQRQRYVVASCLLGLPFSFPPWPRPCCITSGLCCRNLLLLRLTSNRSARHAAPNLPHYTLFAFWGPWLITCILMYTPPTSRLELHLGNMADCLHSDVQTEASRQAGPVCGAVCTVSAQSPC